MTASITQNHITLSTVTSLDSTGVNLQDSQFKVNLIYFILGLGALPHTSSTLKQVVSAHLLLRQLSFDCLHLAN